MYVCVGGEGWAVLACPLCYKKTIAIARPPISLGWVILSGQHSSVTRWGLDERGLLGSDLPSLGIPSSAHNLSEHPGVVNLNFGRWNLDKSLTENPNQRIAWYRWGKRRGPQWFARPGAFTLSDRQSAETPNWGLLGVSTSGIWGHVNIALCCGGCGADLPLMDVEQHPWPPLPRCQ